MANHSKNGLLTKIWGPPTWEYLHSVTFGYPEDPTPEQKHNYKEFFRFVGTTLPCVYCRNSYQQFITESDTLLDDSAVTSRDTLTKWLYLIHEKVNKKLEMNYNTKYEDVVNRYESFRAMCATHKTEKEKEEKGCMMPLNKKAESFKISYTKDAPIISYSTAHQFIKLAEARGINMSKFELFNSINSEADFIKLINNKSSPVWEKRNQECLKIIRNMRINAIPSLEESGDWTGLPTVQELHLIMNFCSITCEKKLLENIKKIYNSKIGKKKRYRLVNNIR